MRRYYQREIFLCLREHGSLRALEICEKTGVPIGPKNHRTQYATQALMKMADKGLVRRDGYVWSVVKGARAPVNMCGRSEGSKLALRSHSRANILRLHLRRGTLKAPPPATALEAAWGWRPTYLSNVACAAQNDAESSAGPCARKKRKAA